MVNLLLYGHLTHNSQQSDLFSVQDFSVIAPLIAYYSFTTTLVMILLDKINCVHVDTAILYFYSV